MRNNLKQLSEDYILMSNISFSQLLYSYFYGTDSLYHMKDEIDPQELEKAHSIIEECIMEDIKSIPANNDAAFSFYELSVRSHIGSLVQPEDETATIKNKLKEFRQYAKPTK